MRTLGKGYIDFVERNIHGAWVVWGYMGIRQYYGYTKAEAIRKYKDEVDSKYVFDDPAKKRR